MKIISDLISNVHPNVVALQSGVLVLFVLTFVVGVVLTYGKNQKQKGEDISRRVLEDL
jgi:hypothetical protein